MNTKLHSQTVNSIVRIVNIIQVDKIYSMLFRNEKKKTIEPIIIPDHLLPRAKLPTVGKTL